jgi:secretion/DNA translocation related TadE-like protein
MIAVLLTITVGVIAVGTAVAARHRAQAAADLAALAGAGRVATGQQAACAWAASVATAMQTEVRDCRVDVLDVVVSVQTRIELGRFGIGTVGAIARAGPVT